MSIFFIDPVHLDESDSEEIEKKEKKLDKGKGIAKPEEEEYEEEPTKKLDKGKGIAKDEDELPLSNLDKSSEWYSTRLHNLYNMLQEHEFD